MSSVQPLNGVAIPRESLFAILQGLVGSAWNGKAARTRVVIGFMRKHGFDPRDGDRLLLPMDMVGLFGRHRALCFRPEIDTPCLLRIERLVDQLQESLQQQA